MLQPDNDLARAGRDAAVLHDVGRELADADPGPEQRTVVDAPAFADALDPTVHRDDRIRRRLEAAGFGRRLAAIQGARRLRFRWQRWASCRSAPWSPAHFAPYRWD